MVKYHWFSLWNWRSVYLGRIIEPAAYFLFLGAGISGIAASGSTASQSEYIRFVLVGIVCLLAFRAATSALSDVANDRKWGVFALYRMQGGTVAGYLCSIVIVGCGVFLAQFAVLMALSALLGASLTGTNVLWLLGFGLLIVGGWVGVGAAVAAKVHSYSRRDFIVTVTALPVVLAAPLLYPLDTAPGYLRLLASFNPLTYQVEWLRNADSRVASALWALSWLFLMVTIAGVLLGRAEQVTTER
jgi:ABC-2 type transport system permease protein